MMRLLTITLAALALAAWLQRDSRVLGEWLRRLTDAPTHLVLVGLSGFEREGRDPEKAP